MHGLPLKCPLIHLYASVSMSRGQSETLTLLWIWHQCLEEQEENLQTFMILARTLRLPPTVNTHSLTTTTCLEGIKTNLIRSLSLFISVTTSSPRLPGHSSSLLGSTQPLSALTLATYIFNILFLCFIFLRKTHHLIAYFTHIFVCLVSFNTKS